MKRVVVIGSGNVAEIQAEAIADGSGYALVQIYARNRERGEYIAGKVGCGWTDDPQSLAEADIYLVTTMYREQVLQRLFRQLAVDAYDYVLLDCPPYLGLILTNALVVSNEVIIPVQAQKAALDGLENLLSIVQNLAGITGSGLRVNGILATMTDGTLQSRAVEQALRADYPDLVYHTTIPRLVEAADSTAQGRSCVASAKSRVGQRYQELAAELMEREGR